jgi:hypothetical protein
MYLPAGNISENVSKDRLANVLAEPLLFHGDPTFFAMNVNVPAFSPSRRRTPQSADVRIETTTGRLALTVEGRLRP